MRLPPRTLFGPALVLCLGLGGCGLLGGSGGSRLVGVGNGNEGPPLASAPQGMRVADAALAAGTPALALQWTDSILAGDPRNAEALLRQGRANLMLGKTADAEASFRRVLAIDARQTDARLALAKLVMSADPAQARAMFQAVLADSPSNVGALNNIGVTFDMQGQHVEAQQTYRKALGMAPELASARQNLGLSLALSGSSAEGVTLLGGAARSGEDRRARDNLALALALNGRGEEAGKMLREGLNPADASTALAGYRALAEDAPQASPAATPTVTLQSAPTVSVTAESVLPPATAPRASTHAKALPVRGLRALPRSPLLLPVSAPQE